MSLPSSFAQSYGPWAVITGASAGIGVQFAHQLAAAGISVALVARRLDKLETLCDEIREKYPVGAQAIEADLGDPSGWAKVIAETQDLDVGLLVNNAGVELHGSFFRDSAEKHEKLITINVTAVTSLAHAFGLRMAKRGRGGIINVSSVVSMNFPWLASYAASKAYVSSFSLILREELRPRGVDVFSFEPGAIHTEMSDHFKATMDFAKVGLPVLPAERVVRECLQAFAAGKARVTPHWLMKFMFWVLGSLPQTWALRLMGPSMAIAIPPEVRQIP